MPADTTELSATTQPVSMTTHQASKDVNIENTSPLSDEAPINEEVAEEGDGSTSSPAPAMDSTHPAPTTPSSESPVSASSSPESRPVSGDVNHLLQQLDGGGTAEQLAARKARIEEGLNEVREIMASLPEGSRAATAQESQGRPLPPGAAAVLIPPGKTISKALLERCVKVGLFPIPPPGGKIFDVIDPADHAEMMKSQAQAHAHRRQMMQMQQHMMSGGMPPGIPKGAAESKETMNIEQFPKGPNGLRIPPKEAFAQRETSKDFTDSEHKEELKMSLDSAAFLEAAKLCTYGSSAAFFVLFMGLFVLWGKVWAMFGCVVSVGVLFFGFLSTVVRNKAAGYQCPKEFLEIPQTGKIAVVTGGAQSVGAEIVKQLFRMGCSKIFVLEKSYMLALQDLAAIKKQLTEEDVDTTEWASVVEAVTCDMSDLNDVFEFTKTLANRKLPIHFLVLNHSDFSSVHPDESNIDPNFMSNYLGHFLLSKQLFLPLIHTGGRVISTSSPFYAMARKVDIHDNVLNVSENYSAVHSFCASKANGILFTKMLAQRMGTLGKRDSEGRTLPNEALSMAFSPGILIDKCLKKIVLDSKPWIGSLILFAASFIAKTPKDAAQTAFKLLFGPAESLKNGAFYNEGIQTKTYGTCNVDYQEVRNNIVKLWQMSNIMVYEHSFEARMAKAPPPEMIPSTGLQSSDPSGPSSPEEKEEASPGEED